MSQYRYSPLSSGRDSIRLLRLMPHEDETADIYCELFEYSLQNSRKGTHMYDALSYVWGNPDEKLPIFIHEHSFDITANLHAALSRLRNHSIERILWVDAICINQAEQEEKQQQIQSMAKIYGQANRVVVWLGEAADDSDLAFEEIRAAGGKKSTKSSDSGRIQQAVLALLQRRWFRRIWILQEVAAARYVLVMCGSKRIDGYVFCLGVDLLKHFYEARQDLQGLIRSVTYLIREASFRPEYSTGSSGRSSLDICPLGELLDKYHAHKATKRHDKVYALLGMSSDDLSVNLLPDYGVPWAELLQSLVKHLLSEKISVETWGVREIAVIKSKGCILGKVTSVQSDMAWDGRQGVDIIFKNIPGQSEGKGEWSAHWNLQVSAKSIQDGDLICLLQGALNPTIIRLRKDHFVIIMIGATLMESPTWSGTNWPQLWQSPQSFTRDFILVWDWESSFDKMQDLGEYETSIQWLEHPKTELEGHLDKATRIWNLALILGDLEEYEMAEQSLQEAVKGYEMAYGEKDSYTPKSQYVQTPLLWAAGNGYNAVVNLMLADDRIDADLKDSKYRWTPLSWAAQRGHETVVKLLLETGKVNINSKDQTVRTPLSWAAKGGHEAVVKLLLETGKVDVDTKDQTGQTPLRLAAQRGHGAVVKLLLETGKVDVDSKDIYGQMPLWLAAEGGHEAVVKLLLKTDKINDDSKDQTVRMLLLLAEEHDAVVKLLLEMGKVDVNLKVVYGQRLFWLATKGGYRIVVKPLLETGKVDVDTKDQTGQTPLSWAAQRGHETVVKLLLETGKVDIDSKDQTVWTPLSWAAQRGHETVVKLLLETGKVNVDTKDQTGWTPLLLAAEGGHVAVVKLLLETGKVDVDAKDSQLGQTPLLWAKQRGHKTVVKLLLNKSTLVRPR